MDENQGASAALVEQRLFSAQRALEAVEYRTTQGECFTRQEEPALCEIGGAIQVRVHRPQLLYQSSAGARVPHLLR